MRAYAKARKRLIQSYVWSDQGLCFFVSTINRDDSCLHNGDHIYSETLVWEYDYDKKERGNIVEEKSDIKNSISAHQEVCEQIHYSNYSWCYPPNEEQ